MAKPLSIPLGLSSFHLRNWKVSDKEALTHYANNRKIWLNLKNQFPYPYQEHHADAWIEKMLTFPEGTLHLIISSEESLIGAIGLEFGTDVACKSANLGYWLGEPHWGKGIATAAVKALVDYAFNTYDLVRISAEVFSWNLSSLRVLEKSGFKQEACLKKAVFKNGEITDLLVFALVK